MLSFVLLFSIIPFIITFIVFSWLGILFLPLVFILMIILLLMIFPIFNIWLFVAILIGCAAYVLAKISELCFKRLENRKFFKIMLLFGIIIFFLVFVKSRSTHVDIQITNYNNGLEIKEHSQKNIINQN